MDKDRIVIDEILDGDKEAYRILVDRYKGGLVRYCYSFVLDEATAMDVAQQAFINGYMRLHTYKPKYAFSTWLYRIARNEALQELKRSKRLSPLDSAMQLQSEDDMAIDFDRYLEHEKLKSAMKTLRHDWREVVHFYYWEGKTYEEIAELTGKPINTVRVWLRRAKQQLEKELLYE